MPVAMARVAGEELVKGRITPMRSGFFVLSMWARRRTCGSSWVSWCGASLATGGGGGGGTTGAGGGGTWQPASSAIDSAARMAQRLRALTCMDLSLGTQTYGCGCGG